MLDSWYLILNTWPGPIPRALSWGAPRNFRVKYQESSIGFETLPIFSPLKISVKHQPWWGNLVSTGVHEVIHWWEKIGKLFQAILLLPWIRGCEETLWRAQKAWKVVRRRASGGQRGKDAAFFGTSDPEYLLRERSSKLFSEYHLVSLWPFPPKSSWSIVYVTITSEYTSRDCKHFKHVTVVCYLFRATTLGNMLRLRTNGRYRWKRRLGCFGTFTVILYGP